MPVWRSALSILVARVARESHGWPLRGRDRLSPGLADRKTPLHDVITPACPAHRVHSHRSNGTHLKISGTPFPDKVAGQPRIGIGHFRAKHVLGLDPRMKSGSREENASNQGT